MGARVSRIIAQLGDAERRERRGDAARALRAFSRLRLLGPVFRLLVGNDIRALVAMRSMPRRIAGAELASVDRPVLIVVGEKDDLAGDAAPLRDAIPGSELVVVPGDHLSAVTAPLFKQSVLAFLDRHSPS